MILRTPQSIWQPFARALCATREVETAGVVLAERLRGNEVFLTRRAVELPQDGYLVRKQDRLSIDPVVLNRIVREARDNALSVFTVHTHPGTHRPWFSHADDAGDARLMPSLFAQMDGPHGSIVLAGATGTPAGRVWNAAGECHRVDIRIVGTTLDTFVTDSRVPNEEPWFHRQLLALGEFGQAVLRSLRIGVVGLGGTGSAVLVQLAHLGVGRLTLVDGDRVDASNVSRVLTATRHDAEAAWKVDVATRYIEQLGLGTEARALRGHLGVEISPADLEDCDVIFCCVDTHTPRALLNRLAYNRAVTIIDLGSAFRISSEGRVVAGAGRVVVVGPCRPCLGCWGHIDPDRLRMEALSAADRARLAADGYLIGASVAQPSVVAFNTSVAGAAVIEFLRLVTSFAGANDPPQRLSFDFTTGEVRRNRLAASIACRICGADSSQIGKSSADAGLASAGMK